MASNQSAMKRKHGVLSTMDKMKFSERLDKIGEKTWCLNTMDKMKITQMIEEIVEKKTCHP